MNISFVQLNGKHSVENSECIRDVIEMAFVPEFSQCNVADQVIIFYCLMIVIPK